MPSPESSSSHDLEPPSDRLESVWHKIFRHVLTGQVDPGTLKRGFHYLDRWRRSRHEILHFNASETRENFAGHQDTTLYTYTLDRSKKDALQKPGHAYLIVFSQDTQLVITTYGLEEMHSLNSSHPLKDFFVEFPGAFAEMIGPTTETMRGIDKNLPNNGYYTSSEGILNPFRDTDPPGQRRGAVAIKQDGSVCILNESEKQAAFSSNFENYSVVSGCSFYMYDTDSVEQVEYLSGAERGNVTYFVTFEDVTQNQRLAHITFNRLMMRSDVKRVLDTHLAQMGWSSYRAAELELDGGGCLVRDLTATTGINTITTSGQQPQNLKNYRRDHYYFCS